MTKIGFIQDREEVILVGQGNGGLAALAWADYVKGFTKGRVRVMPDAGMFEGALNDKTKDKYYDNRKKTMAKMMLPDGNFPNKKCQAANPNNI